MSRENPTTERLGAFSDFLSYGLSYLFVGTVWINHHHLLRYTERAEPKVIGANLVLLLFVSLIPFFTAYMAETRMDPLTTALYAGIFLSITISFHVLPESDREPVAGRCPPDADGPRRSPAQLDCSLSYAAAIPCPGSTSFPRRFGSAEAYRL